MTDPAIHSTIEDFGRDNKRTMGMAKFFETHMCATQFVTNSNDCVPYYISQICMPNLPLVKLNFPPAAFGISKGQLQLQFSVRIAALRIVHCIGRRPSIAPANRIAGNCIASIAAANGIAAGERPVQVHHLAKNHCSALDRRRTLFNVDWSNSSSDSDRTCLKQKVEESSLFD